MGKISTFARGQAPSTVQPSNIAAAGGFAAGLAGLSGKAAQATFEIAQRQKQTEDRTFVATQSIELSTRTQSRFTDWQRKNESDPRNKTFELKEGMQKDLDDLIADSPSLAASEALRLDSIRLGGRVEQQGISWANEQFVVNTGAQIKDGTDNLRTQAFNAADPTNLDELFSQHDGLLVAGQDAFGPESLAEFKEEDRRSITSNAFQGMIMQKRVNEARRLLQTNEFDEVLGVDEKKRLLSIAARKEKKEKQVTDNILAKRLSKPWEFLRNMNNTARVDQIGGFTPIEFTNEGFEQRQQFINANNAKFGTDLPILTPLEEADFMNKLETSPAANVAVQLSGINTNLMPDQVAQLGQQISAKEPALGAAFGISQDNPRAAETIIKGHRLLKSKGVKAPSIGEVTGSFDEYVQDAFPSEKIRPQLLAAGRAALTQQMTAQGKSPKDFTQEDFDAAMNVVIGPKIDLNDQRVFSFRDDRGQWIDEDAFEDGFNAITQDEMIATGPGLPRTASGLMSLEEVKNSRIIMAGDGKYFIQNANKQFAVNARGLPYQLNMKEILKIQPERKSFFIKGAEFLQSLGD